MDAQLLKMAEDLCAANDARLLYLVRFGSDLYGTATEDSDTDLRGIFLPSIERVIMGRDEKSLRFSTGDNSRRNSEKDIDIDLWSAKHWLTKLLPSGDTGALDLLFSPSNTACVLKKDRILDQAFENPLRLLETENNAAYADYAFSQAKKYGIKGSRLGALRAARKIAAAKMSEYSGDSPARLGEYMKDVVLACDCEKHCFIENNFLCLCGRRHHEKILMREFLSRLDVEISNYGTRAEDALKNRGVDYKALSHALRALDQMEELFDIGRIVFPLKNRDKIMRVKSGEIPWTELEPIILEKIEKVAHKHNNARYVGHYDKKLAEQILLSCYGLRIMPASAGNMPEKIRERLNEIEKEHNVRILYAAESGSRAWGLESPDSDYDVRFIYVHNWDWYLDSGIRGKRDTIEVCAGDLDIAGWELRKTLKIFQKGNPNLAEWLESPIVYLENGFLASRLRNMIRDCISQGGMWHHYRGIMSNSQKSLDQSFSAKKWLYVIRPLLAMLWISRGLGFPPVRFSELVNPLIKDSKILDKIMKLVEIKRCGGEKDSYGPDSEITEWVERETRDMMDGASGNLSFAKKDADFDSLFREVLKQTWEK